jgi:phage terminase large subunit
LSSQRLKMSETQSLSFDILDDPQYVDVLFGGSAGGAKSFFVCMWAVMQCRNYKGIAIGLGRKSLKSLRQTTLVTLLTKVHPIMGVRETDFKFNGQDNYIEYVNGSKIILIDMAHAPTDPDYDRFGSLELTHVIVEEVGEAIKKPVDVLSSRRNRMLNKEYGIVGKLVMTCNPTQNFIRQEYYKPYDDQGRGRMQKWPNGEVIIPGTKERKESYRAFVRSSVYDNPFIDDNYIETLKKLPTQERKRLLDGDWNYADDNDSLFKNVLMDRSTAYDIPMSDNFDKFIGVDVADKGNDDTIATLIENGVITHQKKLIIPDMTPEEMKDTDKPISYLYALELIKFAQQNGFTANQAKRIAIEGNGVGVGMRDQMRRSGWFISLYEATSKTRSQAYYDFYQDMDAGEVRMLHGLDDGLLRQELAAHTYELIDLIPVVIKKDKLKLILGHSPDRADSAMIANWIRRGGAASHDPKKNQSRIRW